MVVNGNEETTFSTAEAAVYDRQMRLWGVEAQKRLQNSHIFISGLSMLGSELTKNLVLAGMNVTIQDTLVVSERDVMNQFVFTSEHIGINRAEACLANIQALNPLVHVNIETNVIENLDENYFKQFTAVCLVGSLQAQEVRINEICRLHNISFFTTRCFGLEGIMFADLGSHSYRRSTPPGTAESNEQPKEPELQQVVFSSLKEANAVVWSALNSARKRAPQLPKVYVKNQLLVLYQVHCQSTTIAVDNIDAFTSFTHNELKKNGLAEDYLTQDEISHLARVASLEIVPVCAILGGIVGQEIVKAISQKDEPICNYFCFDGTTGLTRRIG